MNYKKITYKRRFIVTAIGISLLLLLIGIITRHSINDTFRNFTLIGEVKDLSQCMLKMRKMEKDFLLKETSNPEFFESGYSEYANTFEETYHKSIKILTALEDSKAVKRFNLTNEIDEVTKEIKLYKKSYTSLVHHTRVKGFKDYGTIGKMRDQIHSVEQQVKLAKDDKATTYMLTLRRHEKDYLLRHDLKYRAKFEEVINTFISYIAKSPRYNRYQADALVAELHEYKKLFFGVIEKDKTIGLAGESGILAEMTNQAAIIEQQLTDLHDTIYTNSEQRVKKSIFSLFLITGTLSILILLIIIGLSQEIMNAINKLRVHINKLGKGNLPDKITFKGKNEVTEMMESINVLTHNLKNTKEFAEEVGEGKLETQIDVFGNEGDLGGSLVEMRNRLLKVAQEREEQAQNDKIQLWKNNGLAQFSEIIRDHSRDMETLTFQFIKKLITYLGANQGGIFVRDDLDTALHDPEETEVRFVAKALYAYERKKYTEKDFSVGEGSIGICAQEGETVFMTEVPEEYIEITSGLGKAKPKAVLIVPMKADDSVLGVIEIATFSTMESYQIDFVETVAGNLASNLLTVSSNVKTQYLLEQSRLQANELTAQEEELRQNMEELTATQESMSQNESDLKNEIQQLTAKKHTTEVKLKQELELQKLEAEDNRLKLDIVNMNVLIGELSTSGKFITVNRKFEDVLEYAVEEIGAFNIRNFIPEDESDDFDKMWKKVISGIQCERLSRRKTKSGKTLWLKTSYAPLFDKFGELEKIFFVANDVTVNSSRVLAANGNSKENISATKKELEDSLRFLTDLNTKS